MEESLITRRSPAAYSKYAPPPALLVVSYLSGDSNGEGDGDDDEEFPRPSILSVPFRRCKVNKATINDTISAVSVANNSDLFRNLSLIIVGMPAANIVPPPLAWPDEVPEGCRDCCW